MTSAVSDAHRTMVTCEGCGERARNKALGLCSRCYEQRRRRRRRKPIDHGTQRGWNQHVRRGETPCAPCLSAHDQEVAARVVARKNGPLSIEKRDSLRRMVGWRAEWANKNYEEDERR